MPVYQAEQVKKTNNQGYQNTSILPLIHQKSAQKKRSNIGKGPFVKGPFVKGPSHSIAQLRIKPNNTGLPDRLKVGMERLSGMKLDHVKVHYNSPQPAALQAYAYAQGSDIHLSPGQEKHLPHELSHVVQQAQGRVKATTTVAGMAVNDNAGLEREADEMGAQALQMKASRSFFKSQNDNTQCSVAQLFSYQSKKTIEGVSLAVTIHNTGKQLFIEDTTKSDKEVGKLKGVIDYKIDEKSNELILEHFEAHPAGAGLGTLLMFELSQVALLGHHKLISVATPALSAMGAYKAFGGEPRDVAMHEALKLMYLQGINEDSDIHKRFIHEEALAVADSTLAKDHYFNPNSGPVAKANLYKGAIEEHKRAHTSKEDYARVVDLKALSSQIVYDPNVLKRKTVESLHKRWNVV